MIMMKETSTALFIGIDGTKISKCVPEEWKRRKLGPGLDLIHLLETTRWSSNVAWVPVVKKPYCTFVPWGHTGGKLMTPELLGHVTIPYNWKEFTFHKGRSFDCTSILKSGIVAGGRQTVFFAPLNPKILTEPPEILTSDDFTKPRMEHHRSKWRPSQDAVYWVNLARAHDEGLQFCPTRSNAVCRQIASTTWFLKKRETNFIRETLDASTTTEDCTQKLLPNAAAATAAARHCWECIPSQLEAVCGNLGEGRDESESRQLNRWVRNLSQQETVAECCAKHHSWWRKAWIWSRPQN